MPWWEKSLNHPYISVSIKHDQTFVKLVIEEMINSIDIEENNVIIIVPIAHPNISPEDIFLIFNIHTIADNLNRTVFRVFGVLNNGKSKVDHVGALQRQEVAAGKCFQNSSEMVSEKSNDYESPKYRIVEIREEELNNTCDSNKNKVFSTITGSSKFQVMVFKPNFDIIKTANCLCICESYVNLAKRVMALVLFLVNIYLM